MTLQTLKAMKNGPIKKFYLVKTYAPLLRIHGLDAKQMSCDAIIAVVETLG
jgi:hypothetical protein